MIQAKPVILNSLIRTTLIATGLMLLWHIIVATTGAPPYMLPAPMTVLSATLVHSALLADHAIVTAMEMLFGLLLGIISGGSTALLMAMWRHIKQWLLPILVISQALPVFAIAPILVLWLGYGMASKVAMATLVIYFPVTVAIYDGLSNMPKAWVEQASIMTGKHPTRSLRIIFHILLPAALPTISAGLRVATAVVPIGAVVGEWVGSSAGLGHLMLLSNAKMQTDIMFAALFCLAGMGLSLYCGVDMAMRYLTRHHRS